MRTQVAITAVSMAMLVFVAASTVGAADGAHSSMDGLSGGDHPWEHAFDEALLDGRQLYNAGDFEEARDAFVEAVQVLPTEAAPYRNLARTYNHLGRFDEATEYYDIYLRLAPDADDVETIAAERRGAVQRASDEPWRLPADQRMALRALQREIADGRGLTGEDGGAWGLYQTLLELGYAHPDLGELRADLEDKLYEELRDDFDGVDDFLPVLDEEGWKLQRKRLEALGELTRNASLNDEVQRARDVVDVGEALFSGDYEVVDTLAQEVMGEGEEYAFVGIYRVVALERMGSPEGALRVVLDLRSQNVFGAEGERKLEALRARLLQQLGGDEEATELYHRILVGGR